jgi:[NiFe] hydrogenase diaphorase moiety small subunit
VSVQITIDGVPITVREGQSLVEAAFEHGVYIPTLCYHPNKPVLGTCRVCSIRLNGHVVAGCTVPVREGLEVEVEAPDLDLMRREVVELLFAEGIHNCPSCEKSGRCRLQGVAYEVEMDVSEFPYRYPQREPETRAQQIWLERDRCILCHRCVEFVRDRTTGAKIFALTGRGEGARIEMDIELADAMPADQVDEAVDICPVGAILHKEAGYVEPIGRRRYDRVPLRDRVLGRRDPDQDTEEP